MLITLKRTFVYFLIVNYLQLTLMPSFAFAMEKDEILQALPRLEPIKPSSSEERDGWEAPAVLSPAIASQALPVLTISLHRQENGSFQLKMQQTGAAVYSEFLPKGKIAKDYQGHKIDLNLGDALTTQVVFTTINPVCNYLFDIDGHLNLGGSLETEGYFKVQKANSFSLPANLLADSGLFLDNIKTLTQEGSTAPRVIAKRGAIDIRAAGDNKPLEIKAVLESRTGIRIEADTGDLIIASDIKTPSTIFLKSKGNTLLKKTSLIGVGGIEITGAGTVMSSEGLPTLLTNKLLSVTAKSIDLKAGHYFALEGLNISTGYGTLKIGQADKESVHIKGGRFNFSGASIYFLNAYLEAKGSIVVNAPHRLILGAEKTSPFLKSDETIVLKSAEALLLSGKVLSNRSITIDSTQKPLLVGTLTKAPLTIKSEADLTFLSQHNMTFLSGLLEGKSGVTVHAGNNKLIFGKYGQSSLFKTDGLLTINAAGGIKILKPFIDKQASVQLNTGYGTLTLGEKGQAPVAISLDGHFGFSGAALHFLNAHLQAKDRVTFNAPHRLIIGSETTSPVIRSGQDIILKSAETLVLSGQVEAAGHLTVESTLKKLLVGTLTGPAPALKSKSNLVFTSNQGLAFLSGILEGEREITVHAGNNKLIFGEYGQSSLFKTDGLLTINAAWGIEILKPFIDKQASVQLNTGYGHLKLGQEGQEPVSICLNGRFSFSGALINAVNGNVLSKGDMLINAPHGFTLGNQFLYRNGSQIHPMGSGQYFLTLGHLFIKAPFIHLIGGMLGGASATFESPVFTNIGGFLDITGTLSGSIKTFTNQLMKMSLADYQKQGGSFEAYKTNCLNKLQRGRVHIGGVLNLLQLTNGINEGSDLYIGGYSNAPVLIQDQTYSQVQPLDLGLIGTIYPDRQISFYDHGLKVIHSHSFISHLKNHGLDPPTASELSELMDYLATVNNIHTYHDYVHQMIKTKADHFVGRRQYNQSLQIYPTHSYGGRLDIPSIEQISIQSIIQSPTIEFKTNTIVIGRQLQDFEAKLKPFVKVQDLSTFQVPTQLAIFTPTDPVALIHPPHLFRIDPKTLPPAVIISPNRLYLNPKLPRQYDPWFEIRQVMSAIQANLNRGYLDEATTQPEAIYRQLLKNAQDLYQQYQDKDKGKIPALQGVSQSIVFKESGTLELGQGKKIALTKPVLIYEEVALNGINSLRGSLVWPPSYEQATKSIRDNRGGIIADNILLKANTLQIDGRLHADTIGAYQTQNTIINGGTISSGKDSTTVLQAQKLLVMQPTERVNEHGIKETVFAKVESKGRTGIEAGVMEIKAGKISSTSTDPKAMLLRGNHAHLGSVKTIHAIENGTKETAEVTTISSKGGTTLRFGQSLVGEAPYLEGKNLKVTAPNIEMIPVTLRQEQQWTEIKESWWKDTEKTIHKIIETNILPHYKADETITFIGNQTHTAPKIEAPKTVFSSPHGTVEIKQAPQIHKELVHESSSGLVFNKQKLEREDHLTYLSPQITGDLSIEARKAIVETVEGLLSPKIRVKGTLTNSILSEVHNVDVKSSRTLSGLASALIAVAITVGTGGSGSLFATGLGLGGNTLVIGAGQALVTGTATQFTLGTLNNDFDPLKGIKTVFSKEGSLSLATSIVSSGVMGSMGITAPGYNASIGDVTRYVGTKTLVSSGINLAFNNNSLEETLRKGGINFVTDIVGVMGADYLGELYQNGKGSIDFATHKILHGVLGAGLGALKGDPLAGALGGMVAETVADLISDDVEDIAARVYEKAESQGIEFGSQAHKELIEKEVQTTVNWSKVGSILAVSLAKRDIDVGVDVATNALENNFTKYIFQGIKYLSNKWGKERAKKAVKEEIQKGFSKETKELLGETNKKYKEQLFEKPGKTKDQTTLNAAKKELKGEQIDLAKERGIQYDHIAKVENAQAGLLKHIKAIKNRLGFPKLPDVERQSLEKELSKASKLLDHSEQFVPRKTK